MTEGNKIMITEWPSGSHSFIRRKTKKVEFHLKKNKPKCHSRVKDVIEIANAHLQMEI